MTITRYMDAFSVLTVIKMHILHLNADHISLCNLSITNAELYEKITNNVHQFILSVVYSQLLLSIVCLIARLINGIIAQQLQL